MTTKTVGAPRIFGQGVFTDLPVIASDIIFEGSAVGENGSGYSRPLQAGDVFQGFKTDGDADNSGGSAGDINARVIQQGIASNLPVAGATAITANDFPVVYASDDNTFTLTASTNTAIGNVVRWVSSGICDVWFDVPRGPASVDTTDIANEAVTLAKMADLARGSLISGQASDRPGALAAETDAQILIGDGTDLNSVAMSNHATIDNAGALTISALAVDTAELAADAVDGDKIEDNAVSLEHLDAAITPSHVVKFAAEFTWAGGGASHAESVAGVLATDIVLITIQSAPNEAASVVSGAATTDTVTVTLSTANTSNDAVISYVVYRAAA